MDSLIMKFIMTLTLFSTIFLASLLYVYYRNFTKIKSKFTLGLMVFALLFIVQNIVSLYYFLTMMDYYVPEVEIHVFILTFLQFLGFLILLKITWE